MRTLLEDLKARGLACKQIVDIGANAGHWSGMAHDVFPDAAFCLIEPQEEMRLQLEALCAQHPGMQFHLAGAGPTEGNMLLTVWDDLLGSSMLPVADAKALEKGKQREVPILTIDGLLATGKIQIPQLIKLDIQGFELEALKGAETTFGQTEVYILEVSLFPFDDGPNMPQLIDVVNFMYARGYVVYDFPGFARRPFDGALGQCDICFVKDHGFLRRTISWK
jgi:FkbM family methyltransferase